MNTALLALIVASFAAMLMVMSGLPPRAWAALRIRIHNRKR